MADVQPFAALLYNSQKIQPGDVVTEPYDKITPAMQEAYYKRHPQNIVRIILGLEEPGDSEANNKYSRAAQCFQDWQKQGVLARAPERAMYYYEQTFELPKGTKHTRRALIGRVRLTEYGPGQVLPHEHTLSKPKQDRMKLLTATRAHFGQIFLLHQGGVDNLTLAANARPVFDFTDDNGIHHTFGAISDATLLKNLREQFTARTLYIADGHHRFETAMAFRDTQRKSFPDAGPEAAHEFVMATLVDMDDPGLFILPTHRLVSNVTGFDEGVFRKQLAEWFVVEPVQNLNMLLAGLNKAGAGQHWFGVTLQGDRHWLLKLRSEKNHAPLFVNHPPLWATLDVAILHVMILERLLKIDETRLREEANVRYYREPEVAARQVLNSQGQMVFYLNPTRVGEVKAVADARSRMPQKSTDFYPKLPTGLVMYPI